MTAQDGDWERLDAAAATPSTVRSAGLGASSSGQRGRPFRLRRSRGPVLAALDGGGAVFQRRLRDVMIGATVILVPAVALNVWVTILGFDRLDPNDSALPSFLGDDTGSGIEDVAVWLAAVFASFVTAVVGHFAALILLGDRFRDTGHVGSRRWADRSAGSRRSLPPGRSRTGGSRVMALIVVTAQPDVVGALDLPVRVRVLVLGRRHVAGHPGHGR